MFKSNTKQMLKESWCVQVAIAKDEIKNSSEWRNRDNTSIVARTTLNVHDMQEGEVVEGWFRLVPKESRGAHREVELQADPGQNWTPPWERYACSSCMSKVLHPIYCNASLIVIVTNPAQCTSCFAVIGKSRSALSHCQQRQIFYVHAATG